MERTYRVVFCIILLLVGFIVWKGIFKIKKWVSIYSFYVKVNKEAKRFNEEGTLKGFNSKSFAEWPEIQKAIQNAEEHLDMEMITQLKNKHAEYLALQNQINPHFLYNTLEAIRSDAICEGVKSIADTTKALATFFRYTISDVGFLVSLEDEIENIKNYFTIQQYRFGNKVNMKFDFDSDEEELLGVKIPKLTLQPIVENAITHGVECKIGEGTIAISIDKTKTNLVIHINDDGVGMEEDVLDRTNAMFKKYNNSFVKSGRTGRGGIALGNVNSRIKLLFGEEYGLHINSVIGLGTQVEIRLPLISESKISYED